MKTLGDIISVLDHAHRSGRGEVILHFDEPRIVLTVEECERLKQAVSLSVALAANGVEALDPLSRFAITVLLNTCC